MCGLGHCGKHGGFLERSPPLTIESTSPQPETGLDPTAPSRSRRVVAPSRTEPVLRRPEPRPAPSTPTEGQVKTWASVIVPTRNEAANVDPLIDRLAPALAGEECEVIFVDDSDDETPEVVLRRAAHQPPGLSVRLLHRPAGHRAGGLGSAVAAGLSIAEGEWAVVMDGDLQHPPELVPQLIIAGEARGSSVVVASRHVAGGASTGLAGRSRVLVSDSATLLAKVMFPYGLRGITDPMSGYFAVRRRMVDVTKLRPNGFKILMEILVRTPGLERSEVGFVFQERVAGESKASFAEGLRFFKHLLRLSTSRLVND